MSVSPQWQALLAKADFIHQRGNIIREDWVDSKLASHMKHGIYKGDSLAATRTVIKRFINFYVGEIPMQSNIGNLLIATIGCLGNPDATGYDSIFQDLAPEGGQEVWKTIDLGEFSDKLLTEDKIPQGYFETDQGTAHTLRAKASSLPPAQHQSRSQDSSPERTSRLRVIHKVGTTDLTANVGNTVKDVFKFYTFIWELADKDDKDATLRAGTICGFLALVLCRLLCKTPESVKNYIEKSGLSPLLTIVGNDYSISYSPPHFKIYNFIATRLKKGSLSARLVVCQLLATYRQMVKSPAVVGLLMAGCLLHWKYNGMGILNAFNTISGYYGCPMKYIVQRIAYKAFEKQLADAIEGFDRSRQQESSLFPWSRMISDHYHTELSTMANRQILEYLFYLISKIDGRNDIWLLQPWNGTPPINPRAQQWANGFIEGLVPSMTSKFHEDAITLVNPAPPRGKSGPKGYTPV